jgi:2-methylisocitrate lyase-like PEP mutase family enzyme
MEKDQASRRAFLQHGGTLAGTALALGMSPGIADAGQVGSSGAAAPVASLTKNQKLRALLKKPGLVHAPEAYNVLTAKLAEMHGFDAIYIGGNMMSGTYLGLPDWGLISNTEMIEIGGRIAREVSIPAIIDADQAGETALNVYRTVQQYEKAGFAALHIEDLLNPKLHPEERQRIFPGDPLGLESPDRMVVRIRAALDARSDPNFVVIARTLETDVHAIIRRGALYAKAGADVLMNNFTDLSGEEIDRIAKEVPIPLLGINVGLPNRGTQLKVNVYANLVSAPAAGMADALLRELKERGEVASRPVLSEQTTIRLKNEVKLGELAVKWVGTR